MTGPPRVFISYSHDTVKHQERVLDLADRLRADGIDAEIDQYNAAPPEGWPLWCERQIEAADIVLMVCTETYHRRVRGDEERGKGLGVVWEARIIRQLLYNAGAVSDKFVPVLFSDTPPEHIPTPIKGETRYVLDTEDGYEELYRRLTGQPHVLRPALGMIRPLPTRRRQWSEATMAAFGGHPAYFSLCQVPPPPQSFVEPKVPFHRLRQAVLGSAVGNRAVLCVTAVKGMGGIGKTTLAQAICWDPDVLARFSDGILWVTLGQRPDILSLLETCLSHLSDTPPRLISLTTARSQLQSILRGKAVLLVIDDAWEQDDVSYFLVGGPRCSILITTRNSMVALGAHAHLLEIDVLGNDEAIQMLSLLTDSLANADRDFIVSIANSVGRLPLALELCAALLNEGLTPRSLSEQLKTEFSALDILDSAGARVDEQDRNISINASIHLSLKRLASDDLKLFSLLGVIRDDAMLDAVLASYLWECDTSKASYVLRRLSRLSLLKTVRTASPYPNFIVHDLIHDKAKAVLVTKDISFAPTKRADLQSIVYYNDHFLEYCQKRESGRLACLGYIPYFSKYLFWHLSNSSLHRYVFDLLSEEHVHQSTDRVQNAWYYAQESLGQYSAYFSDLEIAWSIASRLFESARVVPDKVLVLQYMIRISLQVSSAKTASGVRDIQLIRLLMDRGIWTPAQALLFVRFSREPLNIVLIASDAPEPVRTEAVRHALDLARSFTNEVARYGELAAMATQLATGTQELALRYLPLAHSIVDEAVSDATCRLLFESLRFITPYFGNFDASARRALVSRAFQIVETYWAQYSRSIVTTNAHVVGAIHVLVNEMAEWILRAWDIGALEEMEIAYVDGLAKNVVDIYACAFDCSEADDKIWPLAAGLNIETVDRICMLILTAVTQPVKKGRFDDSIRVNMYKLCVLAKYVSSEMWTQMWSELVALGATDVLIRESLGHTLEGIARRARPDTAWIVYYAARQKRDPLLSFEAAMWGGCKTEGQERESLFREGLHIRTHISQYVREDAIASMIAISFASIPGFLRGQYIDIVLGMKGFVAKARALARCFRHLSEEEFERCFGVVKQTDHYMSRFFTYCGAVDRLGHADEEYSANIIGACHRIEPKTERVQAIIDVCKTFELPNELTGKLLGVALEAAQCIGDSDALTHAFAQIAGLLPDPLRSYMLKEPPVYFGSWHQVIRPEKARTCKYVRLRYGMKYSADWQLMRGSYSESVRPRDNVMDALTNNALTEWLSFGKEVGDVDELINNFMKWLCRAKECDRTSLCKGLAEWSTAFSRRGLIDVGTEAAYCIHECIRWWP